MFGGDRVEIGGHFIHEIARCLVENDNNGLNDVQAGIESQFFHEQLHHIQREDDLNLQTSEELTLLGEFLYNPRSNKIRNKSVFQKMGDNILSGINGDNYDIAYGNVTSRILLYELVKREIIKPPTTKEQAASVFSNLSLYYGKFSQKERDAILMKYLRMKTPEHYKLCEQYKKELNLPY